MNTASRNEFARMLKDPVHGLSLNGPAGAGRGQLAGEPVRPAERYCPGNWSARRCLARRCFSDTGVFLRTASFTPGVTTRSMRLGLAAWGSVHLSQQAVPAPGNHVRSAWDSSLLSDPAALPLAAD